MHWLVREVIGRTTRRITRIWFRRFEAATRRCRQVQHQVLREKLRQNRSSNFGLDHGFDQIHSLNDFRRQVPIADYSYYAPYIERVKRGDLTAMFGPETKLHMFAMTSGTTAVPKYLPVTGQFLKAYRSGWMLWGIRCYDMHSEIYRLKVFQISSDWKQSQTERGIPCGSISGLTMESQCKIVRERYCVPAAIVKVTNIDAKYYAALRYSLPWPIGMAVAANPSTLINVARLGDAEKVTLLRDLADGTLDDKFEIPSEVRSALQPLTCQRHPALVRELEQIVARTGNLFPKDYWPRLQVMSNWTGGSMGAYLRSYPKYWGDVPVRDIGLIASEGRMTIPIEDGTSGGVLDIQNQFFEFIPESEIESPSPTVLEAHELVEGQQYYILLTASNGLYRYNIHDVVRCTGFLNNTPILEFLNKGSQYSSIAGEKITEHQVCSAVERALADLDMTVTAFTLAPRWADPPYYTLLVEASDLNGQSAETRLAASVDRHLGAINIEYDAKRRTHRLASISISVIPSGTWDQFARERLRRCGGSAEQYKHPCLSSDVQFCEQFRVLRECCVQVPRVAALKRA